MRISGLIRRRRPEPDAVVRSAPVMTAWDTYLAALDALHKKAGAPSAQKIEEASRKLEGRRIGHTTAHELLTGRRMGAWDVTRALVVTLGGDEKVFFPLWSPAWREFQQPAMRLAKQPETLDAILVELRAIRALLEDGRSGS